MPVPRGATVTSHAFSRANVSHGVGVPAPKSVDGDRAARRADDDPREIARLSMHAFHVPTSAEVVTTALSIGETTSAIGVTAFRER